MPSLGNKETSMIRVEYVLFQDAITMKVPRGDDRDYFSLAEGDDFKYSAVKWTIEVNDRHSYLQLTASDGVLSKKWIIPSTNVRYYRLAEGV